MKQTFETWCPLFPGFYNTVFDYHDTESDIQSYNEDHGTSLDCSDFNFGYQDYQNRVAQSFVSRLQIELKPFVNVELTFQEVRSPKEYNFYNDTINIICKVDLPELIRKVKESGKNARDYFKDRYTSCSDFISSHSPHLSDWLNIDYILENPAHRVGSLLNCLATSEISEDSIVYWCDSEYYMSMEPIETV